jgi:2,4-dienoyl-CoA reductase-like NADH-dependent reductase (Old Yellow Enzyme family)
MSRDSSIVFRPVRVGPLVLRNAFVRSATGEGLATSAGLPTSRLSRLVTSLADGEVGLIISGLAAVSPSGRGSPTMTGLYSSAQATAWQPILQKVHSHNSRFIFQLAHGGGHIRPGNPLQAVPCVPTAFEAFQHELTDGEIEDVIHQHIESAKVARAAGADGVQLHLAHGFLLCDFVSPAANRRTDKWGGNTENRLRIVKEIIAGIKKVVPDTFSISVKLNSDDHVPGGVDLVLAGEHIEVLKKSVDFFEISNGVNRGKFWSIRYNLDEGWIERTVRAEERRAMVERGKQLEIPFTEQYNVEAVRWLRKIHPNVKFAAVGGLRRFEEMEKLVREGTADLLSMSRPFIRDPYIVKRFRTGERSVSTCTNCGGCLVALDQGMFCRQERREPEAEK